MFLLMIEYGLYLVLNRNKSNNLSMKNENASKLWKMIQEAGHYLRS